MQEVRELGLTSAEDEYAQEKDLILHGVYDPNRVVDSVLSGRQYLILGQKGSGKSIIACKSLSQTEYDPHLIARHVHLSDFPFSDFGQIMTGADESKFPSAWQVVLSVLLVDMIASSQPALLELTSRLQSVQDVLHDLGLIGTRDLTSLVRTFRAKSFKTSLAPAGVGIEAEFAKDSNSRLSQFSNSIIEALADLDTESKGYLFIDGLDDLLISKESQLAILGGLLLQVSKLNRTFAERKIPLKVVLLCRIDLYERLLNPNKNKIRQDFGITLDWYSNPRTPKDSPLVGLVNLRAKLVDPDCMDFFEKYLSPYYRPEPNSPELIPYLLDFTRHTPRDMLQLMAYIMKSFASSGRNMDSMLAGIRKYSIEYFLPEIKDECDGFFEESQVRRLFSIVTSHGKRYFEYSVVRDQWEANEVAALNGLLDHLFESGAIGNSHMIGNQRMFSFNFRNRESTLDRAKTIEIHRGLQKALNLA